MFALEIPAPIPSRTLTSAPSYFGDVRSKLFLDREHA